MDTYCRINMKRTKTSDPSQMEYVESRNLAWSLKPLTVCMKFILGVTLEIGGKRARCGYLISAFGLFPIICHLTINGPCGLYSNKEKHDIGKNLLDENFFKEGRPEDEGGKILLVKDLCRWLLFLSLPAIHVIFMANVLLTKKWEDMWLFLNKMKLSENFYCKCRRNCLIALSLLILVSLYCLIYAGLCLNKITFIIYKRFFKN